ncbi:MAG: ribonuclease III [Deltaproteobacteria bacterium SG8_13]|nr:MAG: ribonuclease III [Deltaproteobacteria bacterium SG8_13]
MSTDSEKLSRSLQYRFNNIELMEEALRHSSYVNEQPDGNLRNNERLEFLGDAVLNLSVGHILIHKYPDVREGELSRMRAGLVNESQLAEVARRIDLGAFVKLGRGEMQTNGPEKNSILANTFEAIIAAVYLDGGFEAAFELVATHLEPLLQPQGLQPANQDHKSRLQELVQVSGHPVPVYEVIGESGPDHDKTFSVRLTVRDVTAEGTGKSKKLAEQDAASKALQQILGDHPEETNP